MGMFTSVIHPETGEELQFKTGHDNCDTFHVGDDVSSYVWVNPREPGSGYLLDGVYDTYHPQYFVIIKDKKIAALEPVLLNEDGSIQQCLHDQECYYYHKYDIKPLPHDTWTDEVWAKHAKREAENREKQRLYKGRIFGLSPKERASVALRDYTLARTKEDGFLRRILPPVEVTQTADS